MMSRLAKRFLGAVLVPVIVGTSGTCDSASAQKFAVRHGKTKFTNKADFQAATYLFRGLKRQGLCGNSTLQLVVGGLNNGQFAERVLQTCPGARLAGFEVQEDHAQAAAARLAAFPNVRVYHAGWGEEPGEFVIQVSKKKRGRAREGAHLGLTVSQGQTSVGKVKVTPLADWAEEAEVTVVDYLAIDVEGFEGRVIRGLRLESNAARFPCFQYELGGTWCGNRHAGEKWGERDAALHLLEHGYDLYLIGKDGYLPIRDASTLGWITREGNCRHSSGNILAMNAHARPDIRAIVEARRYVAC